MYATYAACVPFTVSNSIFCLEVCFFNKMHRFLYLPN